MDGADSTHATTTRSRVLSAAAFLLVLLAILALALLRPLG